ncbi:MAG TPA: hypothetical protein VFN11_16720 [Ktedonobacterales bacterium]|nr:hypothetical protein [Ktedonobacterales bacterium]
MQAAPSRVPRHLPGWSATRVQMVFAVLLSAFTLVILVFFSLVETIYIQPLDGGSPPPPWHLPWPVLQWAVASPMGFLTLSALGILVVGAPFVLFYIWLYRPQVARARDVTDVPKMWWAIPQQAHLQPPLLHRWLGERRSERTVSLALLVVGVLLFVALVGVPLEAIAVSNRLLNQLDVQPCITHYGCRPPTATLKTIVTFGWMAWLWLGPWAVAWWLRRLEVTSGVWFRYGTWMGGNRLYYVRQPGVTSEAATAALARVSPAHAVPYGRYLFFFVLVWGWYEVLFAAAFLLDTWLQYQWLPG